MISYGPMQSPAVTFMVWAHCTMVSVSPYNAIPRLLTRFSAELGPAMMKSSIFLSYASEQGETATSIELSLVGAGYEVFRDRTSLPAGDPYDAHIRAAIDDSDLFIFLISAESVKPGRYTLTELKFAEQKWQNPAGRVLPVLVEPVAKTEIPAFLRAVTILQPSGNLTAEVAAEVARMTAPWWRHMLKPQRLAAAVVIALTIVTALKELPPYFHRREQAALAMEHLRQSELNAGAGNYAEAWKSLELANDADPVEGAVVEARERLAMKLLRLKGISYLHDDKRGIEDLVNEMLPVLSRGTSEAKGERLANLRAHLGWTDYLADLTGVGGPDPVQHYRQALEVDPTNVFAHGMWGFEILRQQGPLADARQHFSSALASGHEREYVRDLQVSALLQSYTNVWADNPERESEALRVANEMRMNGESSTKGWGPGSFKSKMWAIYYFNFVTEDPPAALLTALPPAEHLSTFQWLFPDDDLPEDSGAPNLFNYLYVLGQLQEQGGKRAEALASYRRMESEFARKGYNSSRSTKMAGDAKAAIKRLSN